jgi:glycine oxidase
VSTAQPVLDDGVPKAHHSGVMAELESADVAVVGAGAIGCAIAWRLAQAGLSVALIEKTRPGAEASSAAGGILAAQVEAKHEGPLFRLLLRSERMYEAFASEVREASGIDPGWRRCGVLAAALDDAEDEKLWEQWGWHDGAGLTVERLGVAQVRAHEPALGPLVRGGVLFPEAGQVDAQRLPLALAACARTAGSRLRLGEVRRILLEAGRVVGVEVDGARLATSAVVVAAGAWSSLIAGLGLAPQALRPVRGQLVRFDLPPPLRGIVFGAGGYLVPRLDGHILAGSTMEEAGFDKSVTAAGIAGILERAARLCPVLGQAPIGALWAGLRPACEDGLPALGPVPGIPGLHLAVGHLRNGIELTPVTAELVAGGVLGKPLGLAAELSAARLFA